MANELRIKSTDLNPKSVTNLRSDAFGTGSVDPVKSSRGRVLIKL